MDVEFKMTFSHFPCGTPSAEGSYTRRDSQTEDNHREGHAPGGASALEQQRPRGTVRQVPWFAATFRATACKRMSVLFSDCSLSLGLCNMNAEDFTSRPGSLDPRHAARQAVNLPDC